MGGFARFDGVRFTRFDRTNTPAFDGAVNYPTAPLSAVDDDESARESLPDLLEVSGFNLQAFSSAEESLTRPPIGSASCAHVRARARRQGHIRKQHGG